MPWGGPSPVPRHLSLLQEPSARPWCKDEPNRGLRGQLLVLAMNFVIVRSLAGEPLEWAGPSIGRAFFPTRPKFQTNLIPQSDSRPTSEVTTEVATGGQNCLPHTHAVTVRPRANGALWARLRSEPATVIRGRSRKPVPGIC